MGPVVALEWVGVWSVVAFVVLGIIAIAVWLLEKF